MASPVSSSRALVLLGVGAMLLSAPEVAAQRRLSRPIGGYIPGFAPALVSCILFFILGCFCCIHHTRHRRKAMTVLLIGLFAFSGGLAARVANHFDPFIIRPFVAQQVILLACPCFFLATSYLTLEALQAHLRVDGCLLFPARWVVRGLVTSDIVTFLLQCAGGGMQASESRDTALTGQKLSTAGLAIQLFSFCSFMVLLAVFGVRIKSRYPDKWTYPRAHTRRHALLGALGARKVDDWKIVYWAQWLVAIGILIRSIYRIVEYADGYTGYLWLHEAFFYLLDVLVLFLAMAVYALVWPPRFLPRDSAVRGERAIGEKNGEGTRWWGKSTRGERVNSDA